MHPMSVSTKRPVRRRAPRASAGARNGRPGLDRAAWIRQARETFIAGGITAIKIGKLASALAVTRESFYWHFKSLAELQGELLADWEQGNAVAYEAVLDSRHDSEQEFRAVYEMWLDEGRYSPAWDTAMRDWARRSKRAARVVGRVDERRVQIIRQIYLDMGCEPDEALVRARIYYFHQVGYYTILPAESRLERLRLIPIYRKILESRR
jgi:AcrR family transcriptional regulator